MPSYCVPPLPPLQMIPAILAHPLEQLPQHCHFTAGVPVKPMLAKATNAVSEVLDKFQVWKVWRVGSEAWTRGHPVSHSPSCHTHSPHPPPPGHRVHL